MAKRLLTTQHPHNFLTKMHLTNRHEGVMSECIYFIMCAFLVFAANSC